MGDSRSVTSYNRRSSAWTALLFLCLVTTPGFARLCPADTIIVDGKVVIVKREVRNSAASPEMDGPREPVVWLDRKLIGGFGGSVGIGFARPVSRTSGLTTLRDFTGLPPVISPHFRADFSLGYQSKDRWLIETGVSLSYSSVRNRYFVGSALGDSIVGFQSPSTGSLEQIRRYQYDIGEETFIDPVDLRRGGWTQLALDVPLHALFLFSEQRGSRLRWMLGTGIRTRLVVNAVTSNWVLINSDGAYEFQDIDGLPVRRFQADAQLIVGCRKALQGKSSMGLRWFVSAPLLEGLESSAALNWRMWHSGISIQINKFFWEEKRRRTTKG